MHHNTPINQAGLPSSLTLIKATLAALIASVIILLCIILPAEFAIDITGVGKHLGLQKMGEIKVSLAQEQQSEVLSQGSDSVTTVLAATSTQIESNKQGVAINQTNITSISPAQTGITNQEKAEAFASDSRTLVLANGDAAELKVALNKGEFVNFNWRASAKVNFDNHGDSKNISYHPYSKGKGVKQDIGRIQAAFDGYHGWFWRNRSGGKITITIDFNGQYSDIKRIK